MTEAEDFIQALAGLAAPHGIAPAVLDRLLASVRPQSVPRGHHFCRQGEFSDAMVYIRAGLLRYYYLSDGIEHTGQFFEPGMMVGDVASLCGAPEALQTIDAITAADVLMVPMSALRAAYDADHGMERVGRRLIEIGMLGSQRRTASLLQQSPEARYEAFVAARPAVARAVPLYLIASYLGITPEALSRIRRRRTAPRQGSVGPPRSRL